MKKKNVFKKVESKRYKIFIYQFLIKAFEKPNHVIRTLFEIESDFRFIIN